MYSAAVPGSSCALGLLVLSDSPVDVACGENDSNLGAAGTWTLCAPRMYLRRVSIENCQKALLGK